MTAPDWRSLATRFPVSWIGWLEAAETAAEPMAITTSVLARLDITAEERTRLPDDTARTAAATELLDGLAAMGWLTVEETLTCPICGFELPAGFSDVVCPATYSHAFTDDGHSGPLARRTYTRKGTARRHVGWLLALHGMNTRGSWQESFNWLVSTSYGRMVPVAIYKYGMVRPGVLSRRRHATLVGRVADRIHRAAEEVGRIVLDPRPDVIAHSFGTMLIGKALHADPELRVGRIVTLGCILRPDFDWATLVERGQVEAVLNNYGTRDIWAKVAHRAIPDAGPAGRRGFDHHTDRWPPDQQAPADRRVFNVPAEGFSHSKFFEDDRVPGGDPTILAGQFARVWQPFLTTLHPGDVTAMLERNGSQVTCPETPWRASPWPLRAVTGGWATVRHTYPAGGTQT